MSRTNRRYKYFFLDCLGALCFGALLYVFWILALLL